MPSMTNMPPDRIARPSISTHFQSISQYIYVHGSFRITWIFARTTISILLLEVAIQEYKLVHYFLNLKSTFFTTFPREYYQISGCIHVSEHDEPAEFCLAFRDRSLRGPDRRCRRIWVGSAPTGMRGRSTVAQELDNGIHVHTPRRFYKPVPFYRERQRLRAGKTTARWVLYESYMAQANLVFSRYFVFSIVNVELSCFYKGPHN